MGSIHPKIGGSTLAAAIVVVLIYVIQTTTKVQVPADVAAAVTTIVGFAIGYLVPSSGTGQ